MNVFRIDMPWQAMAICNSFRSSTTVYQCVTNSKTKVKVHALEQDYTAVKVHHEEQVPMLI